MNKKLALVFAVILAVVILAMLIGGASAKSISPNAAPPGYIDYGLQTYPAGTPVQFYSGASNALMVWVSGDSTWSGGTYPNYFCEIKSAGSCTLPTLLLNPDGSSQYVNYQCGFNSNCSFYYYDPITVTCIPKGKSGKCK